MLLVVDANIIFSAFIRESMARRLLISSSLQLITPEFVLSEIEKYAGEIKQKANITGSEFELLKNHFFSKIKVAEASSIRKFLKSALEISPDKNDVHYFALALKENAAIWSNDKRLKEQKAVRVLATQEVNKII